MKNRTSKDNDAFQSQIRELKQSASQEADWFKGKLQEYELKIKTLNDELFMRKELVEEN